MLELGIEPSISNVAYLIENNHHEQLKKMVSAEIELIVRNHLLSIKDELD